MAFLEVVFRLSGLPTYTFVEPARYQEVKVAIRTPGRCLVVEGPSGIGKTTTVTKILDDLGLKDAVTTLSARRPADLEYIDALSTMENIGTVIVDDFHRLDETVKEALSNRMKILADTEDQHSKLILIGINKAGQQLLKFSHDLGLRIDVFRLEVNPEEKVREVITLGEEALNVIVEHKDAIAERAQGSFQIVQLLAHRTCAMSGVSETQIVTKQIELPLDVVIEEVMVDLGRLYKERWPAKTEQLDKWIPSLTAARMPRNRRGRCRDVHGATTALRSKRRWHWLQSRVRRRWPS